MPVTIASKTDPQIPQCGDYSPLSETQLLAVNLTTVTPYSGVSKYIVAKLHNALQNALCRIVFRLDRTSHVTPFLQKLHWLPISYHISLNII